jgi:hypothetical protein
MCTILRSLLRLDEFSSSFVSRRVRDIKVVNGGLFFFGPSVQGQRQQRLNPPLLSLGSDS